MILIKKGNPIPPFILIIILLLATKSFAWTTKYYPASENESGGLFNGLYTTQGVCDSRYSLVNSYLSSTQNYSGTVEDYTPSSSGTAKCSITFGINNNSSDIMAIVDKSTTEFIIVEPYTKYAFSFSTKQKHNYPQYFDSEGNYIEPCVGAKLSDGSCCSVPNSVFNDKCVSFGSGVPKCAGLHGDYFPTFQGQNNNVPVFECLEEPTGINACDSIISNFISYCNYETGTVSGTCKAYSNNTRDIDSLKCTVSSSSLFDNYQELQSYPPEVQEKSNLEFPTEDSNQSIEQNQLNQLKNNQNTMDNINENLKNQTQSNKTGFDNNVKATENQTEKLANELNKINDTNKKGFQDLKDNLTNNKTDTTKMEDLLTDIKGSLTDNGTPADIGNLSEAQKTLTDTDNEAETSILNITGQFTSFISNAKNQLTDLESQYTIAKDLFSGDLNFNISANNDTSCLSFVIFGKEIKLEICKYLEAISPVLNFVVSLLFLLGALRISLNHFAK